jgi:hypothetical protein
MRLSLCLIGLLNYIYKKNYLPLSETPAGNLDIARAQVRGLKTGIKAE